MTGWAGDLAGNLAKGNLGIATMFSTRGSLRAQYLRATVETGITVQMAGAVPAEIRSTTKLLELCADDNFGRGKCARHIELAEKLSVSGLSNQERIDLLQVVFTDQTLLVRMSFNSVSLPDFSFRNSVLCRTRTTP